jgi:2-octaprenyl-6-methoxyphenol hydroxylase
VDNLAKIPIVQDMNYDTDILVVGGGLNGSALAIALASIGFDVVVVDRQSMAPKCADNFDGRAYALSHASCQMLKVLGVWAHTAKNAQPILDIKVSDGRAGEGAAPMFVHFNHQELEEGPMGHLLEDRYLRRAFADVIAELPNITYLNDADVVGQKTDNLGADITLADGRVFRSRLLVGCDGRGSQVAHRGGIQRRGCDYEQTALVCALIHEHPHNGVAHQFFTPSGPLAILPLPGNRSSIVWTESSERAAKINAMDDAGYLAALAPVFGDFLGDIKLAGERFSYPLSLTLADSFIADRLALVGDAAHGIHPLAGQGLNLGLKDIAALAEVLAIAARRGEDIGTKPVLVRYQQWRRFDTSAMAAATDGINRLFSNDNALLRGIRDLGLGAVNSTPNLRRGFMRHAAGLSGELPKLLRGQVI